MSRFALEDPEWPWSRPYHILRIYLSRKNLSVRVLDAAWSEFERSRTARGDGRG